MTLELSGGYRNYFENASNRKEIAIFGAGLLGQNICKWFLEIGIEPSFFLDNNPDNYGKMIFNNKKCKSFDDIKEMEDSIYHNLWQYIYPTNG